MNTTKENELLEKLVSHCKKLVDVEGYADIVTKNIIYNISDTLKELEGLNEHERADNPGD